MLCAIACLPQAWADASNYINLIRQVQFPSETEYDMPVAPLGQDPSQMPIDPGGARFELWTTDITSGNASLLASTYVGTYIPVVQIAITSEDQSAAMPRTRADRPFQVEITTTGLLAPGIGIPAAALSAKLLEHVQSYGDGGTDVDLDRSQALLVNQSSVTENGTQTFSYAINTVPGADRAKIRGEQRFSAWSLADGIAPESQLASEYIQIWPVADGTISGVTDNEMVRFSLPQLTLTLNDLYPDSTTYAQVYEGDARLGVAGKVVPGSALVINDSVPHDRVLIVDDYDAIFDADGRWTIELVTVTPFGTDRLSHVTFDLDRTIEMNGTFTTIEK